MRLAPPPLSVIFPPPSMTTFGPLSLKTMPGVESWIVAGSDPHENVMTPPFATAATNASAVQLDAEPLPTTVVGLETSSACPAEGTVACPSGQPAGGPLCGFVVGALEQASAIKKAPHEMNRVPILTKYHAVR